jgi:hypothetical protein
MTVVGAAEHRLGHVSTPRRMATVGLAAALALLLAGVSLAAFKRGAYAGSTTQKAHPNGTVRFKVSSDGKTVQAFSGDIFGDCAKSDPAAQVIHLTLNPAPDMAIQAKRFGFHGTFRIDNGSVVIARHVHGTISGAFAPGGVVTGKMQFTWTFDSHAPSGFRGANCSTGPVQYTAKHG